MPAVECRRGQIKPLSCYKAGCRQPACRAANTRWVARNRKGQALGTWDGIVPATQAVAHIKALTGQGMRLRRIAELAGIIAPHVFRIGRGDVPRIQAATQARILAVALELSPRSPVDATGTRRRVGALIAVGWSLPAISADSGVTRSCLMHVMHGQAKVDHDTHVRVSAAYDRMWDRTPPVATSFQRGIATSARRLAARNGWTVPLTWDDDLIDDPAAGCRSPKREWRVVDAIAVDIGRPRSRADRRAAVADLTGKGLTARQIAERIGVSHRTVERIRGAAA